jgi:hypothetical protein
MTEAMLAVPQAWQGPMTDDTNSVFRKWNYRHPVNGKMRYAVRVWDDEIEQWVVIVRNHKRHFAFTEEADRDALLAKCRKDETLPSSTSTRLQ